MKKIRNPNPEDWSPTWKGSKQPRKQRKYLYNAPLHVRRKLIRAHLSRELRQLLQRRSVTLRVGDYVRIERGDFRGMEGYVIYVDTRNYRVYVDCAYITKKNGEKAYYPIHPSKLTVLKLNLSDPKRIETLTRGKNIPQENIEKLKAQYAVSEEELKKVMELNEQFK